MIRDKNKEQSFILHIIHIKLMDIMHRIREFFAADFQRVHCLEINKENKLSKGSQQKTVVNHPLPKQWIKSQ